MANIGYYFPYVACQLAVTSCDILVKRLLLVDRDFYVFSQSADLWILLAIHTTSFKQKMISERLVAHLGIFENRGCIRKNIAFKRAVIMEK